ncbi:MAG TPA: DedA family protein [Acetobacteraceae bacterium]|nr:DedA family protein [Acetobacteraceae bacterium]
MVSTSGVILTFIQTHQSWAAPLVFLLAFGKSIALVSLVLPATAALVAIGGLFGIPGIPFWPVVTAAILGAFLGDWLSYAIGCYFKDAITLVWPLSRYPTLMPRARALFRRWGVVGVFLGRFTGPLRAIVPLAAGIGAMPFIPFQIANLASAVIWAVGLLAPGVILSRITW